MTTAQDNDSITPLDSILSQSIAMVFFLMKLEEANFLESDYYKNLRGNNDNRLRVIFEQSGGLFNPATLQTCFYLLLVVPKELLNNKDASNLKTQFNDYVDLILHAHGVQPHSTYNRDRKRVDYYYHFRNAIAHGSCFYETKEKVSYITLSDINMKKTSDVFNLSMSTALMGVILGHLLKLCCAYINERSKLLSSRK